MKKKKHLFLKLFLCFVILAVIGIAVYMIVKKTRDEELSPIEELTAATKKLVSKVNDLRDLVA
jgi:cell division protein FtsB